MFARSVPARLVALLALSASAAPALAAPDFPDPHGQTIEIPSPLEGELPLGPIHAFAPGSDTSLCMSWEPTIAVDPNDPRVVAVSQFLSIQVSFDGGVSFPVTVTAPGTNPGGDPSLAFDSQGRLFITYLCSPGAGRDVCITGYQVNRATGTVTALPGAWPVNVAIASGIGGNNADKEWLGAQWRVGAPFQDRLHVAWIRLDTNPWSVWATFSSDQGATWSAAQQISAADEGRAWPCHVAVSPSGAAYVAWHGQGGFLDPSGGDVPDGVSGLISMRRSDDGGVTWQPRSFPYTAGNADMTYNVQHEANGLIPGANMWLLGSVQPWILPDPLVAGRVHVVAADDPDNNVDSGDAANVYIVTSPDAGATWAPRRRVDQGPSGIFEIMPTAAINPVNGAIGVAWYDNRALADANFDGIFELDFRATLSVDAGLTFGPEVDFNDGRMDPALATRCRFCGGDGITNQNCGTAACPGPGTVRIGEYNGLAFGECMLHAAWADNATCNGDYDTFYDRDPALGGDTIAPSVACPANVVVQCGDPTEPQDTGFGSATDACDADPVVSYSDNIQPGDCPGGSIVQTINRTWRAVDAAGNVNTCVQQIQVVDNTPPVVVAPAPLVLECNGAGGVSSSDPQVVAWLALASASDECSTPSLVNDAPALVPFSCPPGTPVPITFTATDACGNIGMAASSITVLDTTPPDLNATTALATLWPPNHGLVDVGLSVATSDGCDPAGPTISVSVTSDEAPGSALGAGGAVHCPDAVVGADGSVQLRAERSGGADGRVYRITVTSTDSCGNQSQVSLDVSVPKSQNGASATDSGQLFDATGCD